MTIIKDPNTASAAHVSDTHRLAVTAVTVSAFAAQSRRSRAWNISSSLTLTSAALTPMFYYANTGNREAIVELIAINAGASTGGGGQGYMRIIRNPDAGTLVTAGTTITGVNRNFGSSAPPSATIKSAASMGQTLTGGVTFFDTFFSGGSRTFVALSGSIVVTPGASIGLALAAPTGNTSMAVTLGVGIFNPIDNTIT